MPPGTETSTINDDCCITDYEVQMKVCLILPTDCVVRAKPEMHTAHRAFVREHDPREPC